MGDHKRQSSLNSLKFVDGERLDAWSDAFFMKHSAALERCAFTVLLRNVIYEEGSNLKMCNVGNEFVVGHSIEAGSV